MRFAYLSEVGHSYNGEVGTPGLRNRPAVWHKIEAELKLAIVNLRNCEAAGSGGMAAPHAPQVHGGTRSVKDLAKFHQAEQARVQAPEQGTANSLRTEIARRRLWLQMEGATADADGNVIVGQLQDLKVYYDTDLAR